MYSGSWPFARLGDAVRLGGSLTASVLIHLTLFAQSPGRLSGFESTLGAANAPRLEVTMASALNHAVVAEAPQASSAESVFLEPEHASEPRREEARGEVSGKEGVAEATVKAEPAGVFPGPWYYPARYLHRRPSPLKPIRPVYPANAQQLSGRVTVLLLINEDGEVDRLTIQSASPTDVFDGAVSEAFGKAQFAPALIAGYKVKSQLLAEVSFEAGEPVQTVFSFSDDGRPLEPVPIQRFPSAKQDDPPPPLRRD